MQQLDVKTEFFCEIDPGGGLKQFPENWKEGDWENFP